LRAAAATLHGVAGERTQLVRDLSGRSFGARLRQLEGGLTLREKREADRSDEDEFGAED
jgi:hypothetical protein